MKTLTLVLLLLAPLSHVQDVGKLEAKLDASLAAVEPQEAVEKIIAEIAAVDSVETAPVLAARFARHLGDLKRLEKDLARLARDMEEYVPVYNQQQEFVRGNPELYLKAETAWKAARTRHAILDMVLPKMAAAIEGMKSESQLAGARKVFESGGEFYPRAYAALALGASSSVEHHDALAAALKAEKDATLRVALLDALAPHLASREDLRPLFLENCAAADWQSQVTALAAVRNASWRGAAEPLIRAIKSSSGRVRHEINEALKAVTGVDKHSDPAAWQAWWDEYGDEFLAGTYVPETAVRADDPRQSTFYGLKIVSNRLLLLIDVSDSMAAKPRWLPEDFPSHLPTSRFEVARHELRRAVDAMPADASFDVIVFHAKVETFQPKLVSGSSSTRQKVKKWIDSMQMGPATAMWEALDLAYRMSGGTYWQKNDPSSPDTYYLLTDGIPSTGISIPQFLDKVRACNRFKKILIPTIGIDPDRQGEDVLKEVARISGAIYTRR